MKIVKRLPSILTGFFIIVYIAIFSHLSILRYLSLNAHYYDLGIMDQVVYNTAKGKIFEMTNPEGTQQISRAAIHFDPLIMVLAPLYSLKPTPIILLVTQTVVLALGAIAVYLIAKKILKNSWLALLFVFLYLNYYPMQLSNLFDFHTVTFATTSLLFAFYFLALEPLAKKQWNYLVGIMLMIVTLFTKENSSLTLMFFSGYLWLTKKNKLYIITGAACALYFLIVVFKLIPSFNSAGSFAIKYYDFNHPLNLASQLFSKTSFLYLTSLMTPFGLLSLAAPLQFLISLPELALNLLSSNPNLRQFYFQYTAMITPFVVISAIYGYHRLEKIIPNFSRITVGIVSILLIVSVASGYQSGPAKTIQLKVNQETLAEVEYWRKLLKNNRFKISATGSIAPFFTEHEYFYDFLFDPAYADVGETTADVLKNSGKYTAADYVIILTSDINLQDPLTTQYYNNLKNNQNFQMISDKNGVQVYKKDAA